MTQYQTCLKKIQDDEHEKLFQSSLIQYAHFGTTLKTLKKYKKLGKFLALLMWFFLVIHSTGMFFDDYRAFLKEHKWLYFVVIISYFLPFPLSRLYSYFKYQYLKTYQKEIDAKEYLVCYGKITKVIAWHKDKQCLTLEIEFSDLKGQIQHKNVNIPYPHHSLVKNKEQLSSKQYQQSTTSLQPENLVNALVRLCLLPYSHFIFDVRIVDAQPEQITIFEQQGRQHNHVWYQHIEGVLADQQPLFLFNVSHIFFIRTTKSNDFHIKFQCVNQKDVYILSQLKNFEHFEKLMFNYFSDISFKYYQQLKYNYTSQEEVLWQSPHRYLIAHQKAILLQQLEMKIALTFVGCMIIFFVLILYIHLYALIFLILSIIILISTYLYCQCNQKYFIPPNIMQL